MTTITARDGVLCSDSKVTADEGPGDPGWNVSHNDTKIWRLPDGSVLGAAHNSEDCELLYNWMRRKKRGPAPKFEHVEGLMIKPNGQMWTFEGALWVRVKGDYYAIGSGARFAMSAMDAGATAYRACLIGIKRDPFSGGKVQMLKPKRITCKS